MTAAPVTLGDYLRAAGRSVALAGKSHVMPDDEGCARFAVDPASERGVLLRAGGFVEVDRYDGHAPPGPESGYPDYLRAHGYASADPWSDFVIAAEDRGRVVSAWDMQNVHLPTAATSSAWRSTGSVRGARLPGCSTCRT